jgi:hypothetical protein
MSPKISPSSTLTETWLTAVNPPKFLTISRVSSIVIAYVHLSFDKLRTLTQSFNKLSLDRLGMLA